MFGLQLDATSDITHPVRVGATIINIYPLTTGVSTFYLALLPTYQHINLFPLALNCSQYALSFVASDPRPLVMSIL